MLTSKILTAAHGFLTRDEMLGRRAVTVDQVHGTRVVDASAAPTQADGLWTASQGVALAIKTADCVPLLLEDPVRRRVAAVHAGWRGTLAEIPREGLRALAAESTQVRAALGPHIRACCYEVSEELAQRFEARFGAAVVVRPAGRPHLDLAASVRAQLEQEGVSQIDDVGGLCTSCDSRFHSYRREKGAPGRQLSFIACEWPRGGVATSL